MLAHALLLAPLLGRQLGPDPIFNPFTAWSPSHQFAVHVTPSDRNAHGGAELVFSRGEKTIWRKKLAYTPLKAFIDDQGYFCAYAYDPNARFSSKESNLRILFFDPRGSIRKEQVYARRFKGPLDAPSFPIVSSFFADPGRESLYVITQDKGEHFRDPYFVREWLRFDMRSGLQTYSRRLGEEDGYFEVKASVAIPGTSLLACVESWYSNDTNRICLRDGEGRDRGQAVLPAPFGEARRDEELDARLTRTATPIELQLVRPQTGDTLRVQITGLTSGKISVKTLGNARPSPEAATKVVKLVPKATILLGLPTPKTALRDISQFCVLEGGRFAVLRNRGAEPSIAIVDREGKPIGPAVPLENARSGRLYVSVLERDRLLIAETPSYEDHVSKAWVVNLKARTLAKYPLPASAHEFRPEFKQFIVGDGAGGIAISGTLLVNIDPHAKNRFVGGDHALQEMRCYSRDGRLLWTSDLGDFDVLAMGARTKDFVIVGLFGEVRIIDWSGKTVKKVQCGDHLYPWTVAVSPSSAIAVTSESDIYQYSANGKLLNHAAAIHPNGVRSEFVTNVAYDTNGALWFGDAFGMAQISPKGVISHRIGTEPNRNQIFDIGSLSVSPAGKIYAKDSRTEMIHAFSEAGKWIYSTKPSSTAGAEFAFFDRLSPLQNGGVLFGRSSLPPRLDRIDRSGKLIKDGAPLSGETRGTWTAVGFVDLRGNVTHKLERDANDHWYRMIQDVSAAPDGSAAVLDIDPSPDIKTCRVTIVTREGKPLRTFQVPRCYSVAYDGKQVLVDPGKSICAYSAQGQPIWKADLSAHASPYIAGKTLYLWFGEPSVKRYELPN